MQLKDYLAEQRLTYSEFARRIGTKHPRTVERYAKGQRMPQRPAMVKIAEVTDGKVTPSDFFLAAE